MKWFTVDELKEWNAYLKIEPDIEQALESCVRTVAENPALIQYAQAVYHRVYEENLPFWEAKSGAPDSLPPMFYAAVTIWRTPQTLAWYRERNIPLAIFTDTVQDLNLWANYCKRKKGVYDFEEEGWLYHSFAPDLFRLGRLQFQPKKYDWEEQWYRNRENGNLAAFQAAEPVESSLFEPVLRKGDFVLDVHIPAGEPLHQKSVAASFRAAEAFSQRYFDNPPKGFICYSWLLSGTLRRFLKPDANILEFQKWFAVSPVEKESRDLIKFVFGRDEIDLENTVCDTSLKTAVVHYLKDGGTLFCAKGFRPYQKDATSDKGGYDGSDRK